VILAAAGAATTSESFVCGLNVKRTAALWPPGSSALAAHTSHFDFTSCVPCSRGESHEFVCHLGMLGMLGTLGTLGVRGTLGMAAHTSSFDFFTADFLSFSAPTFSAYASSMA